ncbi:hypothetical protein DPQ33_16785 [Oceanidesulfovibrio indonesiensis]|uniref:Uncharacterized protein n=2 Tax=Oceanidesulfovibrio indonesiensis TaxID=54767 RepID=A0A7M3MBJ2_9BACT|nr:hypothetical protein DPQ33_16785 [Oceanidesulfovibrio indonesiensis]
MECAFKGDTNEDSKADLLKKYQATIDATSPLLSLKVWENLIFSDLYIDVQSLEKSILDTHYFYSATTPSWKKLWRYSELEDDVFESAKEDVLRQFSGCDYECAEVMLHVVGILLRISQYGLLEMSNEKIVEGAKKNVDVMLDKGLLYTEDMLASFFEYRVDEGWGGLGYQCYDTEQFRKVVEYYKERKKIAEARFLEKSSEKMVRLMEESALEFAWAIIHNRNGNNKYYNKPILKYINPETFVDVFARMSNKDKGIVVGAISSRYTDLFHSELWDEIDWLKGVQDKMADEAKKWKGRVSSLHFDRMIEQALKPSVENLEKKDKKQK